MVIIIIYTYICLMSLLGYDTCACDLVDVGLRDTISAPWRANARSKQTHQREHHSAKNDCLFQ